LVRYERWSSHRFTAARDPARVDTALEITMVCSMSLEPSLFEEGRTCPSPTISAEAATLRILTITTLYPNAATPSHGIFVENRLRRLAGTGAVSLRIVAPVPWFPFAGRAFGDYGVWARVPRHETRHGLEVSHPRFVTLPKVGMHLAPFLLYTALSRHVGRMIRAGLRFDLIDAHYFYPDGVAAALLARQLGKPLVITARGTDLNLIPRHALPRRMIRWAASVADASITVCQALKDVLLELDVPDEKIHVLRNGVDLELFRPLDREALRRSHGLSDLVLLSVGHLIERKGHHLVIEAIRDLPHATLLIVGDGPERSALERLVARLGLPARVRFLGALPQDRLPELYSLADMLVLASSREGWANVLLEAMACGTPAVATRIWGTPEVVAEPAAGRLVEERSPAALARGIRDLQGSPPERSATRAYAERFSWDATTRGQLELFSSILEGRPAKQAGAA
jgi:teichuronic acid biosynthesis glycosyltransferase TuaC